jgi:hypothetical protein
MAGGMFAGVAGKGKTPSESLPPPPGPMSNGVNHHRLLVFQDSEINDIRFDRKRPNWTLNPFALMFNNVPAGKSLQ